MASIDDYIRTNIGETYLVLRNDGKYDGSVKPDIFDISVKRILSVVFVAGTEESDIDSSEFLKSYVADLATRFLIPVAIDYIMERTGLSDRIGPAPAGNQNIRNETRQHYNRISALKEIDALLATRLAVLKDQFQAAAGALLQGLTVGYGAAVSSMGHGFLTQDPDSFLAMVNPFVISPGFGVIAIKTEPVIFQQQIVYEVGAGSPVIP